MRERIVYDNGQGGVTVVIPSGEVPLEDVIEKDVPEGVDFEVVDVDELPKDRLFRNAWKKQGKNIVTDITKAKEIAHERRRHFRDAEMMPLDLKATIPTEASQAEHDRQAVRDKYARIQDQIDAAVDEASLRAVVLDNGI